MTSTLSYGTEPSAVGMTLLALIRWILLSTISCIELFPISAVRQGWRQLQYYSDS